MGAALAPGGSTRRAERCEQAGNTALGDCAGVGAEACRPRSGRQDPDVGTIRGRHRERSVRGHGPLRPPPREAVGGLPRGLEEARQGLHRGASSVCSGPEGDPPLSGGSTEGPHALHAVGGRRSPLHALLRGGAAPARSFHDPSGRDGPTDVAPQPRRLRAGMRSRARAREAGEDHPGSRPLRHRRLQGVQRRATATLSATRSSGRSRGGSTTRRAPRTRSVGGAERSSCSFSRHCRSTSKRPEPWHVRPCGASTRGRAGDAESSCPTRDGLEIDVTVSAGLALYPHEGTTCEDVFDVANRRLALAKTNWARTGSSCSDKPGATSDDDTPDEPR